MRPANWIAYEPARRANLALPPRNLRIMLASRVTVLLRGASHHPRHQLFQQRDAPGNHQQPEQKPKNTGNEIHRYLGSRLTPNPASNACPNLIWRPSFGRPAIRRKAGLRLDP